MQRNCPYIIRVQKERDPHHEEEDESDEQIYAADNDEPDLDENLEAAC